MSQKAKYERFGTEKMAPLLFRMSMPMVAAQLVNLLYSIVDRIYIGHLPEVGTAALAGVGLCNTIIILVSSFANIPGGGGAPLCSIALGKGNREEAAKILNNGMFLLIIFTGMLMAVFYGTMDPFLKACGASEGTLPYAHQYLSIYLLGTFFVMVTVGLNPFISSQGYPRAAMFSVIIGAAINIVLDPILMFTFEMGIAGAAAATVISQAVSAVYVLKFLMKKEVPVRLNWKQLKPDQGVLKEMTALGISPFVMGSTEALIGFVLNGQLSRYGGDIYVSALTIMQSGMQFISIPLQGFGQGCIPVLSYNYGNGRAERVKEGFRILLCVSFLFNLGMVVWMVFFPEMEAGLFTADPELIAVVKKAMPLFMGGFCIFGLQRACQNLLVALNQPKTSLFIAFLRKVFLLVPLAYILPHYITPAYNGVYLAESIADFSAAVICACICMRLFPKILKQIQA
ncbi:MAG: MATE family efflux transporter [Bulleidia sp.]